MILEVRVKPNSKKHELVPNDGKWIAFLRSPPVDGKANSELIKLVADYFDIGKSRISIRTGVGGRLKRIEITDE